MLSLYRCIAKLTDTDDTGDTVSPLLINILT